jgi:excisionase family DNA binding protein
MPGGVSTDHEPPQQNLRTLRRLFSIRESAGYLGLSKWKVYDMIKNGILPCITVGRKQLVDKKDLDAFVDNNKEGRNGNS